MRKKNEIENSMYDNNYTWMYYYDRLTEMALSCFNWKNLPTDCDSRFLELACFGKGWCLFFKDDVMEKYLTLNAMLGGELDVYNIPVTRTAYAPNGYSNVLNKSNSVIIFNNYLHNNTAYYIEMFARRLWNLDRIIDVNSNAQKTPILITCNEKKRFSLKNLFMKYDGNAPVIYGDSNLLSGDEFKVLKTDAPYISDKIYELKTKYWNEALTFLGIANMQETKKSRLVTDEVDRSMGGTIASRNSRMLARKQACQQINDMFGLNVDVEFNDSFEDSYREITDSVLNHNTGEVENIE